jgi:hypothetical protein
MFELLAAPHTGVSFLTLLAFAVSIGMPNMGMPNVGKR